MKQALKSYHTLLNRIKGARTETVTRVIVQGGRKGDAETLESLAAELGLRVEDVREHQQALRQAAKLEALAERAGELEAARVEALNRLEKRKDDGVLLGDDGQPVPLSALEGEYHKATAFASKTRKAAGQLQKLKARHPVLFGIEKPKATPAEPHEAARAGGFKAGAPGIGRPMRKFQTADAPGIGPAKSPVVSTG